jgi:hypothetical protein
VDAVLLNHETFGWAAAFKVYAKSSLREAHSFAGVAFGGFGVQIGHSFTKLLRSTKPCASKIKLWRIRHAQACPFCVDIVPLKAETGVRFP